LQCIVQHLAAGVRVVGQADDVAAVAVANVQCGEGVGRRLKKVGETY
jgi:hypothetical protein